MQLSSLIPQSVNWSSHANVPKVCLPLQVSCINHIDRREQLSFSAADASDAVCIVAHRGTTPQKQQFIKTG